jgi:hypothetical protein
MDMVYSLLLYTNLWEGKEEEEEVETVFYYKGYGLFVVGLHPH